ncbi:MAG TPA: hypothetical protein VIN59_08005 [Alphaproteobacteria bacterium]
MLFVGPISFRKQDDRVGKLIHRGHATEAELLEAQFGMWPMPGIKPVGAQDRVIFFKDFLESKANKLLMPFVMAHVNQPDDADDTIYINSLIVNPAAPVLASFAQRMILPRLQALVTPFIPAGTAAHLGYAGLAVAGISFISPFRYAMVSSYMRTWGLSICDIVGEQLIYMNQMRNPNDLATQGRFFKAAEAFAKKRHPVASAFNEAGHIADMATTGTAYKYYTQDPQLQARLHNLLVRGGWDKLPENRLELYAAVRDMGIPYPKGMKDMPTAKELDAQTIFEKNKQTGLVVPPAAEVNIGLNAYYSKEIIEIFWRDYLPLLYADLVVNKYKDPTGYAKMGFSSEELKAMNIPAPIMPEPKSQEPLRGARVLEIPEELKEQPKPVKVRRRPFAVPTSQEKNASNTEQAPPRPPRAFPT